MTDLSSGKALIFLMLIPVSGLHYTESLKSVCASVGGFGLGLGRPYDDTVWLRASQIFMQHIFFHTFTTSLRMMTGGHVFRRGNGGNKWRSTKGERYPAASNTSM